MEKTIARRAQQCILAAVAATVLCSAAEARSLRTVHLFSGPDGATPFAGLTADGHGNFYGTTYFGGATNNGTIFKLAPDGTQSVIYSFGEKGLANPQGPLLITRDGGLAGATAGAIWKVSLAGHLTVLKKLDGRAGSNSRGGLVEDAGGNLFGTTSEGARNNCGAVFKLAPGGKLTVLYAFKGGDYDGCGPSGTLSLDASGNLYGVTYNGGYRGWGDGMLFKIAPDGTETLLHSFDGSANSGDGAHPYGPLLRDAQGNLYGTTIAGDEINGPSGAVYKLSADGTYSVLHLFNYYGIDGKDGASPLGGVIADAKGNLYGTTQQGGAVNLGTVFRIAPDGKETLLHYFNAVDGVNPQSSLAVDSHGNMFGTTSDCGTDGSGPCRDGTIFKISGRN